MRRNLLQCRRSTLKYGQGEGMIKVFGSSQEILPSSHLVAKNTELLKAPGCYSSYSTRRELRVETERSTITGTNDETTHFGFRTVRTEEKQKMVADVFHGVADKYDLMNDLMSGTIHRLWKDEFVKTLNPIPHSEGRPLRVLDVAGGTGDVAFRIVQAMKDNGWQPNSIDKASDVVVCDINSSMLTVGEERARRKGIGQGGDGPLIQWVEGNAEELPIESNSMDAYTIAFGIRNVTNIAKALREAHRVLRKGGRFLCLEFSHVENPVLRTAYDQFSFNVIPLLGKVVTDDRDSYQYLVESIRQFPDQEKFKSMIQEAGFDVVNYTNYTFGIAAVHSGFKLRD